MHQMVIVHVYFHTQNHKPATEHDDPKDKEGSEGWNINEALFHHLNQETEFLIDPQEE